MKRITRHKRFQACIALVCALILTGTTLSVGASNISSLEQKEQGLENELSGLKNQLSTLSNEITDLVALTEKTHKDCEYAELDVAAAKLHEENQYAAMQKRIQYMYEDGNTSLMEIILTAQDMGDFLNKSQFISTITEYDRDMLDVLMSIHADITAKEDALKAELEKLAQAKTELDEKQTSLNETIESTKNRLDATSAELQEARRAQEAARIALLQQQATEEGTGNEESGSSASDSNPTSNSTGGGNSSGSKYVTGSTVPGDTSDVALFAALLQAEAGTSNYDALLAVATIVMNRLESPRYAPTSIRGIIYQSGQFSPTWSGSLDRILARGPASLCYQVAQDAMGGARLGAVSNLYSFRMAGTRKGITIGDNTFF